MSATIETIITCNGGGFKGCEGTFTNGDSRDKTAKQQRAEFPNYDWVYYRGKDYCPACAKRIKRPNPSAARGDLWRKLRMD